jgi:hypothetical protein
MTTLTTSAPPMAHPRDDVLAVIDDEAGVRATIAALRAAGFTEADVHVFRGREGVTALARAWWRHSGVPAFLAPFVAAILSDEQDIEAIYESEGLAGHTVLAVHTHGPDDVDEATRVLRAWGAHDTWYFGRWTMAPVDPVARHTT